ncbi:hypothetical protein PR048_024904 [Dryococelus australis]|uniref:Uncharacterized protein n=1 Tax=Dryococelus australis TaxID=614101 RepID=A0ABQ9GPZ6_9NEOP|nr:hypothetical protein PR048_024904 [Dryococelus australis]
MLGKEFAKFHGPLLFTQGDLPARKAEVGRAGRLKYAAPVPCKDPGVRAPRRSRAFSQLRGVAARRRGGASRRTLTPENIRSVRPLFTPATGALPSLRRGKGRLFLVVVARCRLQTGRSLRRRGRFLSDATPMRLGDRRLPTHPGPSRRSHSSVTLGATPRSWVLRAAGGKKKTTRAPTPTGVAALRLGKKKILTGANNRAHVREDCEPADVGLRCDRREPRSRCLLERRRPGARRRRRPPPRLDLARARFRTSGAVARPTILALRRLEHRSPPDRHDFSLQHAELLFKKLVPLKDFRRVRLKTDVLDERLTGARRRPTAYRRAASLATDAASAARSRHQAPAPATRPRRYSAVRLTSFPMGKKNRRFLQDSFAPRSTCAATRSAQATDNVARLHLFVTGADDVPISFEEGVVGVGFGGGGEGAGRRSQVKDGRRRGEGKRERGRDGHPLSSFWAVSFQRGGGGGMKAEMMDEEGRVRGGRGRGAQVPSARLGRPSRLRRQCRQPAQLPRAARCLASQGPVASEEAPRAVQCSMERRRGGGKRPLRGAAAMHRTCSRVVTSAAEAGSRELARLRHSARLPAAKFAACLPLVATGSALALPLPLSFPSRSYLWCFIQFVSNHPCKSEVFCSPVSSVVGKPGIIIADFVALCLLLTEFPWKTVNRRCRLLCDNLHLVIMYGHLRSFCTDGVEHSIRRHKPRLKFFFAVKVKSNVEFGDRIAITGGSIFYRRRETNTCSSVRCVVFRKVLRSSAQEITVVFQCCTLAATRRTSNRRVALEVLRPLVELLEGLPSSLLIGECAERSTKGNKRRVKRTGGDERRMVNCAKGASKKERKSQLGSRAGGAGQELDSCFDGFKAVEWARVRHMRGNGTRLKLISLDNSEDVEGSREDDVLTSLPIHCPATTFNAPSAVHINEQIRHARSKSLPVSSNSADVMLHQYPYKAVKIQAKFYVGSPHSVKKKHMSERKAELKSPAQCASLQGLGLLTDERLLEPAFLCGEDNGWKGGLGGMKAGDSSTYANRGRRLCFARGYANGGCAAPVPGLHPTIAPLHRRDAEDSCRDRPPPPLFFTSTIFPPKHEGATRAAIFELPVCRNLHVGHVRTTVEGKLGVKRGEYGAVLECKGGRNRRSRENPLTRGIVRHNSHVRLSGSDPAENLTRFAQVGGEQSNHYTTAAKNGAE